MLVREVSLVSSDLAASLKHLAVEHEMPILEHSCLNQKLLLSSSLDFIKQPTAVLEL